MNTPLENLINFIESIEYFNEGSLVVTKIKEHAQSLLPEERKNIVDAVDATSKKCVTVGNGITRKMGAGDLFYHDENEGNTYFDKTFTNQNQQ